MNNGVLKEGEIDLNPRKVDLEKETYDKLMDHFTYHKPNPNQIPSYAAINEAAKVLADTILRNTPECDDQKLAIKKVVEAKMMANSIIATRPEYFE